MFKRGFFLLAGLGAGTAVGVAIVRKVEDTRRRMTPEHMARVAGARAGSTRARLEAAVAEGRRTAATKEAELRDVYRVGEHPPVPPTR